MLPNSLSNQSDLEAAPTEDLWALPEGMRAQVLWDSGAHPNNDVMRALFLSCASIPGIGTFLAMAVQMGLTPNPKFYRGEHRNDPLVWPNGCPVPPPKRAPPRRPSRRALERQAQEFYREYGLFKKLRCGCLEECPGLEWHAEMEAAEEARERELREEHARWDAQRELALADAQRDLADALARATLSRPVPAAEDEEVDSEFAAILAPAVET